MTISHTPAAGRLRRIVFLALWPLAACDQGTTPPPVPTQLSIKTQPGPSMASGAAFSPAVRVAILDAGGAVVVGSTQDITLGLNANGGVSGATLGGTLTRPAVAGVATFDDLSVDKAGPGYTLTATAPGTSLTPATSEVFAIVPGAATRLDLTVAAAGAPSGAAFATQPVVEIRDAAGNTVTSDNGSITMSVSSGATVVGSATATAVSGVATFAGVGISGVAGTSYTLTFGRDGLAPAAQTITPTAGAATQLVLTTAASAAIDGVAFGAQPVLAIRDAAGNTVTSDNASVVSMSTSAGASMVGAGTATVTAGVATFANVGLSGTVGASYTLTFTAPGLPATSQSVTVLTAFTRLAAGYNTTCAVTSKFAPYCWGAVASGPHTSQSVLVPAAVPSSPLMGSVGVGNGFACGNTSAGPHCWGGSFGMGEIGDGTTQFRSSPVPVSQGGVTLLTIAVGQIHACGHTSGLTVHCWGWNENGQLGDGTTTNRTAPVQVQGGVSLAGVWAGGRHSCGFTLGPNRTTYCWGRNQNGVLGDGTTTDRATPVAVLGGTSFVQLAAGVFHTCGRTSSGATHCWGRNVAGALGDGTTTDAHTPVAVAGAVGFGAIAAGLDFTCGLANGGAAYCWGANDSGQLGDGTTVSRTTPVPVQGAPPFTAIAAAASHACGLTSSRTVYCWGGNAHGQLGDGTTTGRPLAAPVVRP